MENVKWDKFNKQMVADLVDEIVEYYKSNPQDEVLTWGIVDDYVSNRLYDSIIYYRDALDWLADEKSDWDIPEGTNNIMDLVRCQIIEWAAEVLDELKENEKYKGVIHE